MPAPEGRAVPRGFGEQPGSASMMLLPKSPGSKGLLSTLQEPSAVGFQRSFRALAQGFPVF